MSGNFPDHPGTFLDHLDFFLDYLDIFSRLSGHCLDLTEKFPDYPHSFKIIWTHFPDKPDTFRINFPDYQDALLDQTLFRLSRLFFRLSRYIFYNIRTLLRSSRNFPVHPGTLHIIWIFYIAKYPEVLQPIMYFLQKLSGFAKTFRSALLTC